MSFNIINYSLDVGWIFEWDDGLLSTLGYLDLKFER